MLANVKFRRHRGEMPLTEWAAASPKACLRRFEISNALDVNEGEVSDSGYEMWEQSATLTMVYPRDFGIYGKQNSRDAHDFIESDFAQMSALIGIGGAANYVTAQHLGELGPPTVLEDDQFFIVESPIRVLYTRDLT